MKPLVAIAAIFVSATDDEPPLDLLTPEACNANNPASIETLVEAWVEDLEIQGVYLVLGGTPQVIPAALERCTSPAVAADSDEISYRPCIQLGRIDERARSLAENPVRQDASSPGLTRRLVSLTGRRFDDHLTIFHHPDEFEIRCSTPAPAERPSRASSWVGGWRVGSNPDALAQTSREVRKFATFNLTDNRETNIESVQIDAALGRAWTHASRQLGLLAYGAVDRSRSEDPAATEDNLVTLGGRLSYVMDRSGSGPADGRVRHDTRFSFDVSYLTDDEFDARGFRSQLMVSPGLDWRGYRFYSALQDGAPVEFAWTLDLTMIDYLEIEEIGHAFAVGADDTARYGADFNALFRPVRNSSLGVPTFSVGYGFREPFRDDEPHLSMFSAGLSFSPSKTSPFSFGVTYSNGEDYGTLKGRDEWSVNLGFRY